MQLDFMRETKKKHKNSRTEKGTNKKTISRKANEREESKGR